MLVEANSQNLIVDAKELRQYFGIEYTYNLGDILKQFTKILGKAIPEFVQPCSIRSRKNCIRESK